jgi:peptidoglycan/LPS O-acetylase OafA/YrhL
LRAFLKIWPSHGPDSLLRVLVLQVAQVATVLLIGWLSYQFVEWPMVRALQRGFGRRAEAGYYVVGPRPA